MTLHVSRGPFTLDPLIAEARRRMKQRRLRVLALLVLMAVAAGVTASGVDFHGSPRGNVAGLGTFLRPYWWGHGRLLAIHRPGRGVEKLRIARPPYYTTLRFEVVSVTGTPATADARIRVTSLRNPYYALSRRGVRVGTLGELRLRHGVITDSITHITFCAPNVDRCGL